MAPASPRASSPRAPSSRLPSPADTTRRDLVSGAGLLILGLATVGTGASEAGAVIALIGALLTIWSIHRFGRLGPDDVEEADVDRAHAAAERKIANGAITLLVGATVAAATYTGTSVEKSYEVPGLAMVIGAALLVSGASARRSA
jgi:hypothetical protein